VRFDPIRSYRLPPGKIQFLETGASVTAAQAFCSLHKDEDTRCVANQILKSATRGICTLFLARVIVPKRQLSYPAVMETSYDSSGDAPCNRRGRETDRVNEGIRLSLHLTGSKQPEPSGQEVPERSLPVVENCFRAEQL
jgi:hypothetical protein